MVQIEGAFIVKGSIEGFDGGRRRFGEGGIAVVWGCTRLSLAKVVSPPKITIDFAGTYPVPPLTPIRNEHLSTRFPKYLALSLRKLFVGLRTFIFNHQRPLPQKLQLILRELISANRLISKAKSNTHQLTPIKFTQTFK